MKGRDRRISIEFYQWLLLPALLFIITSITVGTRWRGVKIATTVFAASFFLTAPGRANDSIIAKDALQHGSFSEARGKYQRLAEKSRQGETRAGYRLGEAIAAYRGHDFRGARTAFSRALLSTNKAVLSQAHQGMGNSLFQLGWQGLADESYPADPTAVPDINRFDTLVKERLAKLRESEAPEEGETSEFVRIESMITNWTDSVRHYDSALAAISGDKVARNNRALTLIYLKRLKELLKDEENDAKQSLPQQGEGQPQEGEGAPGEGEPGEGEGNQEGDKDSQGQGANNPNKKPGDQGKKPEDKDGKDGDKKNSDKPGGKDPNEGPEDRARRLLKENADLEKGPLTPGRREFSPPEKDW
jgi:Ca-activated chloride channel homolog